ncbi:hypothetical protein RUM43_004056 [Polyplax serrata]|uniref:Uncharacterized protein n=1 Tax=Polyplax serrata TaxID=468196 RepID=A0AAN8SAU4_POLSC
MDWNRMVRRLQHLYVMREYPPQNDWQPKPITLTAIRDDPESGTRTNVTEEADRWSEGPVWDKLESWNAGISRNSRPYCDWAPWNADYDEFTQNLTKYKPTQKA